jgi:hypothetical protein
MASTLSLHYCEIVVGENLNGLKFIYKCQLGMVTVVRHTGIYMNEFKGTKMTEEVFLMRGTQDFNHRSHYYEGRISI